MKQLDRGWIVTWSAVGVNLASGILYSWSVFAAALVTEFGFTKIQISLPYTIALGMVALLSIPGGRLQDRFGPRICIMLSGVLLGSGLILTGFADSIPVIVITFGLMTGGGLGLAYGATTPAAAKWFPPEKRGLITGLVVGGAGLSSVYIAPLTHYLVRQFGIQKSFVIEGIILSAAIIILAQFLSNPPAGYVPRRGGAPAERVVKASLRDFSPAEMIRTTQFRLIWLMYACGAVAGLMIIGHVAIIAQAQANIDGAFILVAILAVFNAGGRVAGGLASDKLGRKTTLIAVLSIQALNMSLFSLYSTQNLLILGIGVAGVCYGSLLAIFPALTFDYFGIKNGGVNYGIVFSAWGVAGSIGPLMAGYIVDATASYHLAYVAAAGLLGAAALVGSFLKPPAAGRKKGKSL